MTRRQGGDDMTKLWDLRQISQLRGVHLSQLSSQDTHSRLDWDLVLQLTFPNFLRTVYFKSSLH